MENKILGKVLELTISNERLTDEVNDHNNDILLLNTRVQALIGIMGEKDNISIVADEERNEMIALLDLGKEVPENMVEDGNWVFVSEILETWPKFNEIFGDELTESAKQLMTDLKAITEQIKEHVCLLKRIQKNVFDLIQILRNENEQDLLTAMENDIDSNHESIVTAFRCLKDLDHIRSIFPELTDFNSTSEEIFNDRETPFEESRPFPDAWILFQ
jgi:hypothetical protein